MQVDVEAIGRITTQENLPKITGEHWLQPPWANLKPADRAVSGAAPARVCGVGLRRAGDVTAEPARLRSAGAPAAARRQQKEDLR